MKFEKVIRKAVRAKGEGIDLVADVDATIAANVGTGGSASSRSSRRTRIVQRSGRTVEVTSASTDESSSGTAPNPASTDKEHDS
jgi:hypothetical protein